MKMSCGVLFLSLIFVNTSYSMKPFDKNARGDAYLKNIRAMKTPVKRVHRHFRFLPPQDLDRVKVLSDRGREVCIVQGKPLYVPINCTEIKEFNVWFNDLDSKQQNLFVVGLDFIKQHDNLSSH